MMIQLFFFITAVQWSPGPLNLLALNSGLQGSIRKTINFCIGVGIGVSIQYIVCGFISQFIVHPMLLPWIAGVGSLYIMWLGFHMIKPDDTKSQLSSTNFKNLSFRDGLLMQVINPKGFVAALPAATIYFPSLGIHGLSIVFFAIIFGIICLGSVLFYTFLGHSFSKWITKPGTLKKCNIVMGLILFALAFSLDWEYIIHPLIR
jgi:threonine/homoserine/homoserine lactone efflux protein